LRWLLIVVAVLGFVVHAHAQGLEKRVALIIGNDDYLTLQPKLANAGNDARAMDQALKAAGFETTLKINARRRELYQLIDAFAGQIAASPDTVGLFYYAGHGIQANGTNYLIPVDADIASDEDLEAEAVDAGKVLRAMDQARNRINIVILDACRDNPLPKSRSLGRGLARMDAPRGTFIGYAAAPGQTAADGPNGGNGIFTSELVHAIGEPGLPIEQMFKRVIAAVGERTGGKQAPWMEVSLQGEFYFVAPSAQPAATTSTATPAAAQPAATPPAAPVPSAPPLSVSSAEVVFWQSISTSNNAADFEAYLKEFPQGTFALLARNRLAMLTAPPRATAPAPAPAPADDASWPAADRQTAQFELTVLQHFHGTVDGQFGADTRAAIQRWQAFDALEETGHLTADQRTRLTAEGQLVYALLNVGPISPRGTSANAIRDAYARFNRGAALERGQGQPKDVAEAAYWYALAASQGWAPAYTNLGTLWVRGDGVLRRDPAAAELLWKVAAALGEGTAMFDLGVMYEKGVGVAANPATAKRWYARGAERNHAGSVAALQRLGG